MKFNIEKPTNELTEGYFSLILKYLIVFIVSWIGGWILLLFLSSGRRHSKLGDYLLNYAEYTSVFIALIVIIILVIRVRRKYKLGLLTYIEFGEDYVLLNLLNTINGEIRTQRINKRMLKVRITTKDDFLFGKQRILSIYDNNTLINILNVELTAWIRHSQIDHLITKLMNLGKS